jgi:hypothetical protein
MPNGTDDDEDFRQPVVDTHVALELSQLRSTTDAIHDAIERDLEQQLERISRALDEISGGIQRVHQFLQFTLWEMLLAIIIGFAAILGTLRNWF